MTVRLITGDCREHMAAMEPESVDSCVCDPPYHLTSIVKRFGSKSAAPAKVGKTGAYARASRGFMGQQWDGGDVAFDPATWEAVFRVMKPGSFLAAFGGTRTFHRLVCAIEDAGFEVRDTLSWNFGSGFPKSHNISKALAGLPACRCRVSEVGNNLGGIVDTSAPLGLRGATVGAEARPVLVTGAPAKTHGLGLEAPPKSNRRKSVVNGGVKDLLGHLDPVMLGPFDVTGVAEREQIAQDVCGGQVDPKPLRNHMVGNEAVGSSTVDTSAVPFDSLSGDGRPSATLVAPSLPAPGGVAATLHAPGIVEAHAFPRAIDTWPPSRDGISFEVGSAGPASEDRHGEKHSTTPFKCERCGGVIEDEIPQGLGTALKPAMELICLARKPISEQNVAANVLAHGTGALNIDGCRIETGDVLSFGSREIGDGVKYSPMPKERQTPGEQSPLGRWPANIIHDGSEKVLAHFPDVKCGMSIGRNRDGNAKPGSYDGGWNKDTRDVGFNDSGSAARFFYCAKATSAERGDGNNHPTVKPVDLMRWLCRLVTPKGGTVLDPFAGSGSTLIAADREQFNAIGIELSEDYAAIARRRLSHDAGMFAEIAA